MRIPTAGQLSNLVSGLKGEKQATFTALYDAYGAVLFNVISKILTKKADAQDALQNTFVKIWSSSDSYNAEKGSLFTWMLNIAHHEAIDVVRSKHHKQFLVIGSLNDIQIAERKNAFIHLDTIELHKLLTVLMPMDRAIFELIFFRGYSCQQTSEMLCIPCGTIKTKLQSGYRKLRTTLSKTDAAKLTTDSSLLQ